MLAMVGDGLYENVAACADALVKAKTRIDPDPEIAARYEQRYTTYRKLYPALKETFAEISRF